MIALIRKINESIRVNNNVDEIYVMATFLNTNAHHAYAVSRTKKICMLELNVFKARSIPKVQAIHSLEPQGSPMALKNIHQSPTVALD